MMQAVQVQCEIRYFWAMALWLWVSACGLLKGSRAKQSEKDSQVFLLRLLASSYLKLFSQPGHCMNFLCVI